MSNEQRKDIEEQQQSPTNQDQKIESTELSDADLATVAGGLNAIDTRTITGVNAAETKTGSTSARDRTMAGMGALQEALDLVHSTQPQI